MAEHDLESQLAEKATIGSGSTYPESEIDRSYNAETKTHNDSGRPDINHAEVEEMDAGHQLDLHLTHTRASIKPGPRKTDGDALERSNTRGTVISKLSRIATSITTRNYRARRESEKIPEQDLDNDIVGWEGQNDPAMPLNFPDSRKWLLLSLLAAITFLAPLASSMFAPGVQFMNADFGNSSELLTTLTVSIFVLGFAVGPLFLSPLSEIYGRRPILAFGNCFFVIWQIGCALAPNLGSLIAFRFLAGVGGSACLTIGGGLIADLFRTEQRGFAGSMYSIGPLFGPVIGPIAGGFIAQRIGWRWVFWILLIATALCTIGIECLTTETNPRVLIDRKVERLRKELNRPELHSCYDLPGAAKHTKAQIILSGMLRPLKMLFFSPITFVLSLYISVVYGLLYLLFTTITAVFQSSYHWSAEICGLAYLGIGIGFFIGLAAVARISDSTVIRMTKANEGVFEPEMRLPSCVIFACMIPVSFFWYGWSAYYKVHWIVPIIGLVPFGIGMMGVFIPIQTYLIDAFPEFAASAIAALTTSRSLFGAFLPLAGPQMYRSLGLGWGNSTLGFIGLALIPVPALIYKYGGKIRKDYPIKL